MKEYKKLFPLLEKNNIVYLDSSATMQKPTSVIKRITDFYENENANAHRSVYALSSNATIKYEEARTKIADFIGAKESKEIIFVKNATEGFNLIAYSYGLENVKENNNIVLSIMEHHSNLVPWQMVSKKTGAKLKYMYIDSSLSIPESELEKIDNQTKIVAITLVSNVLGTIVDVKKIIDRAHKQGAIVVVDATQAVAHMPIDVQELDADFLVFSGHKMYAPLGIGVVYGKKELLEKMPPFLFGGDMIEFVHEQETTFAPLPEKFEAGTQNIAGAIALASAVDFIKEIGYDQIQKTENDIYVYAIEKLKNLDFVDLYLPKEKSACVISFNIKGIHPHDVSSFLDAKNVCVRSGNHCAQPLLRFMGLDSTCRISISIYNTKEDIDKLADALEFTYNKFKKYLGEK